MAFVPTKYSKLNNIDASTHTTYVYTKPTRKKKIDSQPVVPLNSDNSKNLNKKPTKHLNIHKAKYEVMKFASQSFKGNDKEDVKVALALSLGAKPEKKKAVNYKELLLAKKKEKKQQLEIDNLFSVGKHRGMSLVTACRKQKGDKSMNVSTGQRMNNLLGSYGKNGSGSDSCVTVEIPCSPQKETKLPITYDHYLHPLCRATVNKSGVGRDHSKKK